MKTAEEWTVKYPLSFPFIDSIEPIIKNVAGDERLINLIREIQLDAFKAGAEWAAKIAKKQPRALMDTHHVADSIISAVSNLKELPK